MSPTKNKLSIKKSLTIIAISVIFCSLLPSLIVNRYYFSRKLKMKNKEYVIRELIQTGPVKEALKSEHLEELLGLSVDCPQNIYSFDFEKALQNLYESGVIKQAHLSIEEPNALVVDYTLRNPIAYVGDFTNLVIDEEGMVFPLSPYFTPKRLPIIYFGIHFDPSDFGKIEDEKFTVAFQIWSFFKKLNIKNLEVLKIDVSKIRASSVGRQEIVVVIHEELGRKKNLRYLRLNSEEPLKGIEHYLSLKSMAIRSDQIIDLRLLPHAYMSEIEEESL